MFKVRIELHPEGGWNRVAKEHQFVLFSQDEMPYIPQIGSYYDFELTNKDIVAGRIESVTYHRPDKSTQIVAKVQPHMWDYDEMLKAGWEQE